MLSGLALRVLKKLLPRRVICLFGYWQVFHSGYRHHKLTENLVALGSGKIIPWVTYPAIEYLETLDLSDCTVFEFGAGSSILYWAARCKKVASVDKEIEWVELIRPKLPDHCRIKDTAFDDSYVKAISEENLNYDIIVIDGAVRYPCAEKALAHLSATGMIILDNADWYPNASEKLRSAGLTQIDFCGFSALNAFQSVTAIFFNDSSMLRRRKQVPPTPIGTRKVSAYDDCPYSDIDPSLIRNSKECTQ